MPAERTGTPDIYADLERRLMTAGFASGAKLMPSALQHEYGCSANTVRDVLLQLSKVGLAVGSMREGGLAWEARLTAAHHSLSHIEREIERQGKMGSLLGLWSDAELAFHETLISACEMPVLIETFASIYKQFRQQITGLEEAYSPEFLHHIVAEHQAILDAALSRDEDALRAAIRHHQRRHFG